MAEITELIRRYLENSDQPAFAELVSGHADLVYSVALRQLRGDAHLAEEVTQEVFLVFVRKAAQLTGRPTLNGWFYHTAVLVANAVIRREQRRRIREQRTLLEDTIMHSQVSVESGEPDWETTRPAIDQAISHLTERERDAILLRFFENRSFPEISRVLRVSEDAARMRVERALDKLRSRLTRRGLSASSAAALATLLSSQAGMAAPAAVVSAVTGTALASAGSAISTASLILFMSTTKLTTVIATIAVLASLGIATYEVRGRHEAAASIAALRKSVAESAVAEKSDKAQIAQLQQSLSAMTAQARTRRDLPAANSKAGSSNTLSMEDLVKKHPELRALYKRMMRQSTVAIYGSALTSLGLPADKLTQLESLLTDLRFSQNDAGEAALAAGLQPGDPGFGDAVRQAQDADRQQILALIGNDGWAQLQKAQFTNNYQTQIDSSYAPALQASGVPLSNDQSQALVQAMYDVLLPSVNAAARDPGYREIDPQTWLSPSDQDLVGRASQVLSAEQVAVMKQKISDDNQLHAVVGSARLTMH